MSAQTLPVRSNAKKPRPHYIVQVHRDSPAGLMLAAMMTREYFPPRRLAEIAIRAGVPLHFDPQPHQPKQTQAPRRQ